MKRNDSPAFTLIEIMFVLAIIGLLMSVSFAGFIQVRERAIMTALLNDLRVYSHAFNEYATVNGDWPRSQKNSQDFPEGMEGYLPSNWKANSPVGGQLQWRLRNPNRIARSEGFIQIRSQGRNNRITASQSQLQRVDSALDDGDLSTGVFQTVGQNRIVYYLKLGENSSVTTSNANLANNLNANNSSNSSSNANNSNANNNSNSSNNANNSNANNNSNSSNNANSSNANNSSNSSNNANNSNANNNSNSSNNANANTKSNSSSNSNNPNAINNSNKSDKLDQSNAGKNNGG